MSDIDHEYTDEVVCPHCGFECGDSWEFPDEDERQCDECEEYYTFVRDYKITYVSQRA